MSRRWGIALMVFTAVLLFAATNTMAVKYLEMSIDEQI